MRCHGYRIVERHPRVHPASRLVARGATHGENRAQRRAKRGGRNRRNSGRLRAGRGRGAGERPKEPAGVAPRGAAGAVGRVREVNEVAPGPSMNVLSSQLHALAGGELHPGPATGQVMHDGDGASSVERERSGGRAERLDRQKNDVELFEGASVAVGRAPRRRLDPSDRRDPCVRIAVGVAPAPRPGSGREEEHSGEEQPDRAAASHRKSIGLARARSGRFRTAGRSNPPSC